PRVPLVERCPIEAGTEEGVWEFVRSHLAQLPLPGSRVPGPTWGGGPEILSERQNYLLFGRMVAFHVRRGVTVPLSAAELYAGLQQRFLQRDGMYFLPDQVAEFDGKRISVNEVL